MARRIKLKPAQRERARIRDLAREVCKPADAVLEYVRQELHEYIPSVLSYVERPLVDAIRAHFGLPAASVTAEPPSERGNERPTSAGLGAPLAKPAADNNPFKGELAAFRVDQDMAATVGTSEIYTTETPRRGPGDYSAAGALEPSETMKYHEWRVRNISAAEEDVWRAHGLDERHARVAARCIEAGILPPDLARMVSGFTVLERVTRGEPPEQVARLMRRAEAM